MLEGGSSLYEAVPQNLSDIHGTGVLPKVGDSGHEADNSEASLYMILFLFYLLLRSLSILLDAKITCQDAVR